MSHLLVDTSMWISFFRGDAEAKILFPLLDTNCVYVNELILAELVPSIAYRNEKALLDIMDAVPRLELRIVWSQITQMQITNLKNGINKVGIPDLIIAQNCLQHDLPIITKDKHFSLMKAHFGLKVFENDWASNEYP